MGHGKYRLRFAGTLAGVLLASLAAASCGEDGIALPTGTTTTTLVAATTTSATTTSGPVVSSSTVPTSTTAAPTTTEPPTTTTLAPEIPVVGWDGAGIRDLTVVEITFDPPIAALDMGSVAREDLELLGFDVVEGSDNLLSFALEGSALSGDYYSEGSCYTGARVAGTATLVSPGLPTLQARLSGEVPPPEFTLSCEKDPAYAPFDDAFEKGLLAVAADLWGPAAAPLFIQVTAREVGTSVIDLALKAVAMGEFRDLDPTTLPFAQQEAMLAATIEVIAYLVDTGHTAYGADQAARRLLTAYSGTDFGAATLEDVGEWRAWLEGWSAGGDS